MLLAWLVACRGTDTGTATGSPTPSTPGSSSTPIVLPTLSCTSYENQPCFDNADFVLSSDGCACVAELVECGDDSGDPTCLRYDPATWVGGTAMACSDGGTLVAGEGPESSWWAYRFDAEDALLGSMHGGSCGTMYVCPCCDGVVVDAMIVGSLPPCDPP